MSLALAIHPADNVATALEDIRPGEVEILGESPHPRHVVAVENVCRGHKLALELLAVGAPVIKFGVIIGNATAEIPVGAWVHTHNCASSVDARSATLDRHTGAPTDTKYE